jgi:probable F420-dependent oxidoreductase
MHPIRIAAQLHPQHGTTRALRTAALHAEDLGYDILYTWDHRYPLYGDRDGAHFECWSLLAAWAAETSRIELGPLVSCLSYRNPVLLADIARTVDHLSDGRLILGLGAGWARRDYDAFGIPFGTFGSRIAALGAAIPTIQDALRTAVPPPVRRLPLLIAGQGQRRTLRLVAESADQWHAGFPDRPAELEPVVASLRAWGAEVGRDPAAIEWSVGVEPNDLARFLAEDAEAYVAMGFTQFTLGFDGPGWTVAGGRPWLAWRDAMNA